MQNPTILASKDLNVDMVMSRFGGVHLRGRGAKFAPGPGPQAQALAPGPGPALGPALGPRPWPLGPEK